MSILVRSPQHSTQISQRSQVSRPIGSLFEGVLSMPLCLSFCWSGHLWNMIALLCLQYLGAKNSVCIVGSWAPLRSPTCLCLCLCLCVHCGFLGPLWGPRPGPQAGLAGWQMVEDYRLPRSQAASNEQVTSASSSQLLWGFLSGWSSVQTSSCDISHYGWC